MKTYTLLLALALIFLMVGSCAGGGDEADTMAGAVTSTTTDPGCSDGDCPPDPGCSDGGCDPNYRFDCCCVEDAAANRTCCCKSDFVVTCRLSVSSGGGEHQAISDVRLVMGEVPSTAKGSCAPHWFPEGSKGGWWPPGCGWMNQIHKCGPPF